LQSSAQRGANIVVLPEMWNCPYSNDSFPTYAEDFHAGPSPSTDALAAAAKRHGVVLVGGSVPERHGGKLYNACCVYDVDGSLLGKHRYAARLLCV
jgi:omega-amidase